MEKQVFHPNAYLSETRNVQRGLASRTKILRVLESKADTAKLVAEEAKLTYGVVLHHLHLLGAERIVSCEATSRPYSWKLTGLGQQRL